MMAKYCEPKDNRIGSPLCFYGYVGPLLIHEEDATSSSKTIQQAHIGLVRSLLLLICYHKNKLYSKNLHIL
jgi:hypothetical protein